MGESIEDFLGLDEVDIRQRMDDARKKILTVPGTGYLHERLKLFRVQPWPLVIYLAHNHPTILSQALHHYVNYDGAEAGQTIMEQLQEYYILVKLLENIQKKEGN